MTVSSSVDFNQTVTELLKASLWDTGALGLNQTPGAALMQMAMGTANRMLKAWHGEGLYLWKNKEIALFMGYEEYSFDIGPSGDHATASYVKTEIATASASGGGTVTVDDDEGMTTGDYIGIELDDGTLQWTTINGAPVTNVVTLTDVLTDSCAVDNHVYTYTTKANRPLEIIEARLHRASGYETNLLIQARSDYMLLSSKTNSGTPNQIYFDPQRTDANIRVWPANGDVQDWIIMTVKDPIMDLDSVSNDFDFPVEWYEAIEFNTAIRLCPKLGRTASQELIALANLSKENARDFDSEQTSTFIRIG